MNKKMKSGLHGKILCLMTMLLITVNAFSQEITVKGKVRDTSANPVIGANVHVTGTRNGVITDVDGNYTLLNVPANGSLSFSYIGMTSQTIKLNGKTVVNVILEDDTKQLDEVVVTALGMKRETKALGYSVTEVKGDELKSANTISPVAALQGKVAGVEISQSDGGMFGSTKILIRGASTLKDNNQPIYVVDGIILDNSTSNTGNADWDSNINDYGNELKNLNPDDFETVAVLKGAAATALYGSRGLNGAVVITTKSGKNNSGLGINVSQSFGIDHVYKAPDLQNEYVIGAFPGYAYYSENGNKWNSAEAYSKNSNGVYSLIAQNNNDYAAGWAWGPHISWFKGKEVEQYDGTIGRMNIFDNNYKDAYQTGFNSNTNVAISGGNEKTKFYTSLSYKYADGTTPRNTFNRLSIMAKASHRISKRVNLEASFTFANSTPRNAQQNIGENFANGTFPREYDVNYYKNKYKGTHGGMASTAYGDLYGTIPGKGVWWNIYENDYRQKETSVRPTMELTVDLTNWLTARAGGNYNYYYIRGESKELGSGYANEGGYYKLSNYTKEQTNAFVHINANKQLNKDFELHGFIRGEYFNQEVQQGHINTSGGLIVPGQYFIENSKNQVGYGATIEGKKRILSYAFQAGASYKDQIFLDITGRNDWSSALVYSNGTGNYSYFYPSISGSWLIHETFRDKLPHWISFAKIRASWAQVGNDTDPYYINTGYKLSSSQFSSSRIYSLELPSTVKSTDLKPERKNAWEIGLDWRFLNNRIGIDATYYKENTKDQIMEISLPWFSGLKSQLINAGNIQNAGVEISLNTTPVKTRDFEWDLNLTYTKNDNKIVSLSPNVADYIKLDGDPDYGNYRVGSVAKVGGSYGMLMTDSKPKIDEKTGLPVLTYSNSFRTAYYQRSGVVEEAGSMTPDFLGSVATNLSYKNWSLHIALDARFGGYVASFNSRYATAYGFSGTSLKYRNGMTWTSQFYDSKGMTFNDGFIPQGIFAKGTMVTPANAVNGSAQKVDVGGMTYQECVDKGILEPAHLESYAYYSNSWGQGVVNDNWFKKLNYIALREVNVSYSFSTKTAGKIGAKSLSLSLVGRNLGYLLNTAPNHENPESVRGTTAQSFRMRSFSPYTASYIFTINAGF
jgi:iron complex outermembrane receptor protein